MDTETIACPYCEVEQDATRKKCRRCRRVLHPASKAERRAAAQLANYERWSREPDGARATAAARAAGPGGTSYWLDRVDPDRQMSDHDRARAADNARRAYFTRLGKQGRTAQRINKT